MVAEHAAGKLNSASIEAIAAAQEWDGAEVYTALAGGNASELAAYRTAGAYAVEHHLLARYTADGYAAAYKQLIEKLQPGLVLFPHTYQVRDWVPKLATSMRRVLVSDVIGMRRENGAAVFVRQLFQGKVNADVRVTGEPPCFASLQTGAWRATSAQPGTTPIEVFTPRLEASEIRTTPMDPFREAARAVDLAASPILVSVGRGIKDAENLPLVQELADALGAELAASRPICDNGWLPMERQVGSSGQTVAPKAYFAVGISGAIQHLVGMKGSKTVIAINRDPEAPIFEVADYGIVGDLFEVVPALTEAIKKAKS